MRQVIENKGITLIAVVVTIIVLLILAGVSIAMLTGENGILTQAQKSKVETEQAEEKEKNDLINAEEFMTEGQILWTGSVNKPKLAEGMTPVYWAKDNSGELDSTMTNNTKEILKGAEGVTFKEENWYEYVAGDNTTDSRNSRWANAQTSDGSYWVWIPRYEYKIIEKANSSDKASLS